MIFEIIVSKNERTTNIMKFESSVKCIEWFNGLKNIGKLSDDHSYEIEDVTEREILKEKVEIAVYEGEKREKCCKEILNFTTGYNVAREYTTEQVNKMQELYGSLLMMLAANRIDLFKGAISAITPDGKIITDELKNGCIHIIGKYNL